MKKILCLMLALLMTASLWACSNGNSENADTGTETETTAPAEPAVKQFMAGYGRENVTPDLKDRLTLGGSGTADRESEGILDFLPVRMVFQGRSIRVGIINDIAVLHYHYTVQILSCLCYGSQILVHSLIHLG